MWLNTLLTVCSSFFAFFGRLNLSLFGQLGFLDRKHMSTTSRAYPLIYYNKKNVLGKLL
jgi:hypothetical protein